MMRRATRLWLEIFFDKTDTKGIGQRLEILREYAGLTRRQFGKLFSSQEGSVYQWEHGRCVPRLVKLINISAYFGVSLDCILCGRETGDNALEKTMCGTADPLYRHSAGQIMRQYHALPDRHKERLMGYLDALDKESNI